MHYDSQSEPILAEKYLQAAESNGERFVAESTQQARRFEGNEFDSILACSRLLTLLGFAFYRSHRNNGIILGDAAAWRWLHLLRGVKTVHTAVAESNAGIDPIMSINMIPEIPCSPSSPPNSPGQEMHWFRNHPSFQLISETHAARIESLFDGLVSQKARLSQEEVEHAQDAIAGLDYVTRHICTGEVQSLFRAICTWPGSISTGFADMLMMNEPFALVVYAHWLMLMVLADGMWWFDDMGIAGIREVACICSLSDDPEMARMLDWPVKLASADRSSPDQCGPET